LKARISATLVFLVSMVGGSSPQSPVPAHQADAAKQLAHVGEIDFFGYASLDVDKVRAALPIRQDQELPADELVNIKPKINEAVQRVTGHPVTDVTPVCCDERRYWMVYVGLEGSSSKPMSFDPAPAGSALLPGNGVQLYDSSMDALSKAVRRGAAGEDRSKGYALSNDPDLRATELAMRDYVLQHPAEVLDVLRTAANAAHRRAAAHILGYADQSQKQIDALVSASRDLDAVVRNNAVRALMVLAGSSDKTAALISASPFIGLLTSRSWTDRNKGGALLLHLTKSRDPKLLAQLRSQALPALFEMAEWQPGHAYEYRVILGRIAGLPDEQIEKLAGQNDQGKALVAAVRDALH
jgi:hypothetical protein